MKTRFRTPLLTRRELFAGTLATTAFGATSPAGVVGPHHKPLAKHVIFLYMSGAYSHVDTFDPKPRLTRDHDVSIGKGDPNAPTSAPEKEKFLKAPLWAFKPNPRCGTEVSDLFPHIREVMDSATLIRSMHCDHNDHGEATLQLHTGSTTIPMPSLGAWLSYGLGPQAGKLPAHMVISEFIPYGGAQPWGSSFLPATHRGTRVVPGADPLPNLKSQDPAALRDLKLDFLAGLNGSHLELHPHDAALAGRAGTFGAAKGLQEAAPEALDLQSEPEHILKAYGCERGDQTSYAAQCIMARRLVERGVRFIEIIDSVGACRDNWDSAHRDVGEHAKYAKRVDQPIAALVRDLKQRGLFEDTLLVFCTEFGRTPWAQGGKGTASRNHHRDAFSVWLAGGGVKAGIVYGATDDIGNKVAENPVHVHDFHATILHIMGFNHERLTFRYAGRDFRLTDVHGHVVKDILA